MFNRFLLIFFTIFISSFTVWGGDSKELNDDNHTANAFYAAIKEAMPENSGQQDLKIAFNRYINGVDLNELFTLFNNSASSEGIAELGGRKVIDQVVSVGKIGVKLMVVELNGRLLFYFGGLANGLKFDLDNPNLPALHALGKTIPITLDDGRLFFVPKIIDELALAVFDLTQEISGENANFEFYSFCLGGMVADRLAQLMFPKK